MMVIYDKHSDNIIPSVETERIFPSIWNEISVHSLYSYTMWYWKGFTEAIWQWDVNWKRSQLSSCSNCMILYLKELKDSTRKYPGPIINVNKQMFKENCFSMCKTKWNQSYTSDAANTDKNFLIIQKTILRINKWDCIKSKTFCIVKGNNSRVKISLGVGWGCWVYVR